MIRLKAFMPDCGCRKLAHTFNRPYAVKERMTIGKTFASYTISKHQYEIQGLRRKLKHKRPRPGPKHLIWGTDLTYLTDAAGQQHPILGIVEHQSRVCLKLDVLQTKANITLLRNLFDVIEALGHKPRYLRTDNEVVFTSLSFRFGLWLFGIKHQRTEICCPWHNIAGANVEHRSKATMAQRASAMEGASKMGRSRGSSEHLKQKQKTWFLSAGKYYNRNYTLIASGITTSGRISIWRA